MQALIAFAATLVSLRLAAELLRRHRRSATPGLLAWTGSLAAFAVASGALAWGAAAGWSEAPFRLYYLFGGLLTAALLGAGSLQRAGVRRVTPVTLVYVGLATGVALAVPVAAITGTEIPAADEVLDLWPARVLAIVGNVTGTAAAVGVALVTWRRRPLGNALVIAGLLVAAAGSALTGLTEGGSALFALVAAALLYLGFVTPARVSLQAPRDGRAGVPGSRSR